jgi:glycosyltransferase involved in cell wall biosynthesis
MRVLVTASIFPPDIGGPATYVPQIAKELTERGHEVVVLTLADRVVHRDTERPFDVVRIPRRLPRFWRWTMTVSRIVVLGRCCDVLYVNGLAMEATLANCVLRRRMVQRVPGDLAWERATDNRWTEDALETFQRQRYGWRIELIRTLRRWWTRQADHVIVPSRCMGRWVASWGVSPQRIVVVPTGVNVDPDLPAQPNPVCAPLKLIVAGRLVPLKRVDRVVEAVGALEGVGLLVVGDGPERERLERMAERLGLADRVHFAGARPRDETLALIRGSDVMVVSSIYETYPHVVLEAMALGVPVIASAVGGVPEIIENGRNGRLIADGRVEELRGAIEAMRSPEERRRLAAGGLETASKHTVRRMVEETIRVLRPAL